MLSYAILLFLIFTFFIEIKFVLRVGRVLWKRGNLSRQNTCGTRSRFISFHNLILKNSYILHDFDLKIYI